MNTYKITSLDELKSFSAKLLKEFSEQKVVAFYGEMGVGKTTLIKELCQKLGVEDVANSPTFSIVNEYHSKDKGAVYHFDFYRIEEEEEVLDLGYEDYFYSDSYCFVEWPEKIPNLLPDNYVKVCISIDEENNRLISVAS